MKALRLIMESLEDLMVDPKGERLTCKDPFFGDFGGTCLASDV
jgi:hypothetical protein